MLPVQAPTAAASAEEDTAPVVVEDQEKTSTDENTNKGEWTFSNRET